MMDERELLSRISFNARESGGRPMLKSTRLLVEDVFAALAEGRSKEDLGLEPDDLRACMAYARRIVSQQSPAPIWTKESILDTLAAHVNELRAFGVQQIGLFGSYARDESITESDIDFLVVFDEVSFGNYFDAKFFLEELFGREVDLVPRDDMKPGLREHILKEVVYAEKL
jgi:hypothetical protein